MPRLLAYPAAMPRKSPATTAPQADWFLPEWMDSLRVTQAELCRETGMSKSTVSEIVNGKTHYYRALVNELARALKVEPFELLMHPDEAFALRRMRQDALRIAAETRQAWHGFEPEDESRKRG